MTSITYLLVGVLALLVGGGCGYLLNHFLTSKKISSANDRAEKVVADAKKKADEILADAKKNEDTRSRQILTIEQLLNKKEGELESRAKDLEKKVAQTDKIGEQLEAMKIEVATKHQQQISELERVANLTTEAARSQLFAKIEEDSRNELYSRMVKFEQQNKAELDAKAREIMTLSIQRYAGSHIADATTTVVSLPNDEVKGKIIGKEGRNIKAIERMTGVDVIIDDTPEALVISGFDPVRRQIAKLAIDKLIADGRIHPAKIEETVLKAKEELNEKIKEAGEAAIFEVGIGAVDPKLVYLLGRLAYRTSYGQNVLVHSTEMAHVAGMIASELGADVMVSKKGALFHDIGKAVDHEVQGTHVEIGRKILQKFGIDEKVIRAMESHHEEYPYSTLESRIVQTADAISGARPGARRDTVEVYIKRLEDLERIAKSFSGVEKSYAIQAGRELRVFVFPSQVDDLSALKMSRDIAHKIESEMKYPGEIKVNVIRETRAIEYAR